jgi:hypothetical protein
MFVPLVSGSLSGFRPALTHEEFFALDPSKYRSPIEHFRCEDPLPTSGFLSIDQLIPLLVTSDDSSYLKSGLEEVEKLITLVDHSGNLRCKYSMMSVEQKVFKIDELFLILMEQYCILHMKTLSYLNTQIDEIDQQLFKQFYNSFDRLIHLITLRDNQKFKIPENYVVKICQIIEYFQAIVYLHGIVTRNISVTDINILVAVMIDHNFAHFNTPTVFRLHILKLYAMAFSYIPTRLVNSCIRFPDSQLTIYKDAWIQKLMQVYGLTSLKGLVVFDENEFMSGPRSRTYRIQLLKEMWMPLKHLVQYDLEGLLQRLQENRQ